MGCSMKSQLYHKLANVGGLLSVPQAAFRTSQKMGTAGTCGTRWDLVQYANFFEKEKRS